MNHATKLQRDGNFVKMIIIHINNSNSLRNELKISEDSYNKLLSHRTTPPILFSLYLTLALELENIKVKIENRSGVLAEEDQFICSCLTLPEKCAWILIMTAKWICLSHFISKVLLIL